MAEEVHLGLPGPWAEDYREKADHYTTKIGGVPDWPTEDVGAEAELLQCKLCGTRLCLVAQASFLYFLAKNVYAPLAKLNIEERTLWKVLRVQKCHGGMQSNDNGDGSVRSKEKVCSNEPTPSYSAGKHNEEENKSSNSNDDDFDLDALAAALEQAATVASNTKKKYKSKRANNVPRKCAAVKEKVNDLSIPVLPCFYIYYDKEQSRGKASVGSSSYEKLLAEEMMDMGNDEEEKWEGEKYEYDKAPGADRTFLKFKKRLDAYPQQCFRYSCGGSPLLPTTNSQDVGTCKLCGSQRQYELQLMSPLSYFLDQAGDGSSNCAPNAWTWLTLVIYTCSKIAVATVVASSRGTRAWEGAEELLGKFLEKFIGPVNVWVARKGAVVSVSGWWPLALPWLAYGSSHVMFDIGYNSQGEWHIQETVKHPSTIVLHNNQNSRAFNFVHRCRRHCHCPPLASIRSSSRRCRSRWEDPPFRHGHLSLGSKAHYPAPSRVP
uniref:Programmed cell death protein 2-like protein n=1 Tax=Aegilops tauschii TaxID=37682 RepID=M8CYZ5_AEGTA